MVLGKTNSTDSEFSTSRSSAGIKRRLPIGAEALPTGGVHFRVWTPRCGRVEVVLKKLPKEISQLHWRKKATAISRESRRPRKLALAIVTV